MCINSLFISLPQRISKIDIAAMATNTRKRSAFSVFKSSVPGKENNMAPSEIVSTPNLAQIGLAEYEEHKMAVKGKKRVRRGSLPSINQAEQVNDYDINVFLTLK